MAAIVVWRNDAERAILRYREGTLRLDVFAAEQPYRAELERLRRQRPDDEQVVIVSD